MRYAKVFIWKSFLNVAYNKLTSVIVEKAAKPGGEATTKYGNT